MKVSIIYNGLWPEELRIPTLVFGTGGHVGHNHISSYSPLIISNGTEATESILSSSESTAARDINMYTGSEGMRAFDEAVRREVEISGWTVTEGPGAPIEVTDEIGHFRTSTPPVEELEARLETVVAEEAEVTPVTYLDEQQLLLRNGGIDTMTFLDNISEHDERNTSSV